MGWKRNKLKSNLIIKTVPPPSALLLHPPIFNQKNDDVKPSSYTYLRTQDTQSFVESENHLKPVNKNDLKLENHNYFEQKHSKSFLISPIIDDRTYAEVVKSNKINTQNVIKNPQTIIKTKIKVKKVLKLKMQQKLQNNTTRPQNPKINFKKPKKDTDDGFTLVMQKRNKKSAKKIRTRSISYDGNKNKTIKERMFNFHNFYIGNCCNLLTCNESAYYIKENTQIPKSCEDLREIGKKNNDELFKHSNTVWTAFYKEMNSRVLEKRFGSHRLFKQLFRRRCKLRKIKGN